MGNDSSAEARYRQLVEQMSAKHALSVAISADFGRLTTEDEITKAIGRRLAEHLDITSCSVADYEDGCAIVRSAYTHPGAVDPGATRLKVSDYFDAELQAELRAGKTVVLRDIHTDPRADAVRYDAMGVRAGVVVPQLSNGELRHSFAVAAPVARDWRPDEIALLEEVAGRYFPRIERARAEEALLKANAELRDAGAKKDQFLAVLSHELRNPLAAITSSLFVLEHATPGGEQSARARRVISRQVEQLSGLVNDLLDVSRMTRNKVELHREPLDLNEVVRRATEDIRFVFDHAGVRLELSLAPRRVPVSADRTRLAQMIGNLLQNAAKFTPHGGSTRVSVAVEGGDAVVRVLDTGTGIEPATLPRLFAPFVQAEQALDRSKGGLGLGLVLVKNLAELHGGSATARSEGPGKGSEFTIRLPLDSAAVAEAEAPDAEARVHRRVLIIEDNLDAAESLREALELEDHEVTVAADGTDGLRKLKGFRADVVLCDIGLPGMDGYAVARAVRSDPSLASTYLVALTGYARAEDVQLAREAGFDGHLAKPIKLDVLERTLAALPERPALQ